MGDKKKSKCIYDHVHYSQYRLIQNFKTRYLGNVTAQSLDT